MSVALLFAGQGAQKVGMGRSLVEDYALARDLSEGADRVLGWSLSELMFGEDDAALTPTSVCQPALFVHGQMVFQVMRTENRLGDVSAALGLSLGELTALTAAEAFDFETGLRLVAERGRLMQEACEASEGAMASVIGLDRAAVEAICAEADIDMANLNCPGQIVISGEADKVKRGMALANERGASRVIPLKVAGAYHSRLMEPARAAFEKFIAGVEVREPKLTVYTNTTGQAVSSPDEIRAALVKQIVSPVLWEDCMRSAQAKGVGSFVECGPGKVLAGLARRIDRSWPVTSVAEAQDLTAAAR